MEWLPENYQGAWTLGRSVSREGICLHSGEHSTVTLSPSVAPGINFVWAGEEGLTELINPNKVVSTQLCTTLRLGNKTLSTVEHLFGALIGCGVTHVQIKVSGEEIPLLDGSAIGWVEAIKEAGLESVKSEQRKILELKKPLIIHKGRSVITATPADSFSLIGIIDFPYPAIGQQSFSIDLTPRKFVDQIAPARTFGFKDQIDQLREQGLIKGGSLENSLVCDDNFWVNPPLRFQNEPVRHKLLDLIGDLALVGLPKAQVLVYRGSHALHVELAAAFLKDSFSKQPSFD
ncbi:UDP-3-O-acyl-N-acetylglucosamine deacetylase [Prochlorococcus marinus]|uniref:UDP-3-O-acyl-N-acetylglucosamine deacetylase n=1 Tax=Prochlorococcus marinus (strain MIT 9211) TaxID=93059 RepID=A9BBW0_PROM4|nr:UDP-3-O-acyl-N-acetylglucosamine deacetylase [Prochlorococcus marinus]ABX09322.1 UDP-3-0-acyl N-acetylglucosamine deacetylase [Prochlorococcus marinus str. MIT 9211]